MKTKQHATDFFHFYDFKYMYLYSSDVQCQISATYTDEIWRRFFLILGRRFSGSGEEDDLLLLLFFFNCGHLGHSAWPNFTILRLWSQVLFHVKFEYCRSSGFTEDVWLVVFNCWRTTHNTWTTLWCINNSLWPFGPVEIIKKKKTVAYWKNSQIKSPQSMEVVPLRLAPTVFIFT